MKKYVLNLFVCLCAMAVLQACNSKYDKLEEKIAEYQSQLPIRQAGLDETYLKDVYLSGDEVVLEMEFGDADFSAANFSLENTNFIKSLLEMNFRDEHWEMRDFTATVIESGASLKYLLRSEGSVGEVGITFSNSELKRCYDNPADEVTLWREFLRNEVDQAKVNLPAQIDEDVVITDIVLRSDDLMLTLDAEDELYDLFAQTNQDESEKVRGAVGGVMINNEMFYDTRARCVEGKLNVTIRIQNVYHTDYMDFTFSPADIEHAKTLFPNDESTALL